MDIRIIPMVTDEDIEGKGVVHWQSWHETYTDLVHASYNEGMTREKLIEVARKWKQNHLVAKDGDRVIGYIGYGALADDDIPDCGLITGLYVLAQYYGQKIGYALMNAAVEKLADYKTIAVWVLKGNDKAIRFYERYGFRFDGTEEEIVLGKPNTQLRMLYTRAS